MTASRMERLRGFAQASDKPAEIFAYDDADNAEIPNSKEHEMNDKPKVEPESKAEDAPIAPEANQKPVEQKADDGGASIRAEERARIATVFASEDVKGREQAAAHLLASSDMPADGIVSMLPKLNPSADDGKSQGQQMLDVMAEDRDADLGIDAGQPKPAANHGWGDIHADIREARKN